MKRYKAVIRTGIMDSQYVGFDECPEGEIVHAAEAAQEIERLQAEIARYKHLWGEACEEVRRQRYSTGQQKEAPADA